MRRFASSVLAAAVLLATLTMPGLARAQFRNNGRDLIEYESVAGNTETSGTWRLKNWPG